MGVDRDGVHIIYECALYTTNVGKNVPFNTYIPIAHFTEQNLPGSKYYL